MLYYYWLEHYKESVQLQFRESCKILNEGADSLQEYCLQEDRFVMEHTFIIAMTTTGSSRYHNALKGIGPVIVIVKEVA